MTDLKNKKWDFSAEEKYAIEWFEEHGFSVTLERQFISKTKFTVVKGGVADHFELPQGMKNFNVKKYMEQYEKSFARLCDLQMLRKQVAEQSGADGD